MKKKLLILSNHFSTGGAPQFTLKKIELLKNDYDILCLEYDFLSGDFVVQRNKVIEILGGMFMSVGDNKQHLIDLIEEFNPDIISMEEFPENFMRDDVAERIYRSDRTYTILETTHSSLFCVKKWMPDKFIFVSEHSAKMYGDLGVDYEVVEYPIDSKFKDTESSRAKLGFDTEYKHVVNVGLFTSGKNQGYAFELARKLQDHKIIFHFVGNLAGNFQDYWKPIMENKPDNCKIWGERKDVDDFLQASDLLLFTSKFELNPLVPKEALVYGLPVAMFNLDTYCGSYDGLDNVSFLSGDVDRDVQEIKDILYLDGEEKSEYQSIKTLEDVPKHEKSYVLYANEKYFDIVKMCVKSIREFSLFPIYVYMLNSDLKIDMDNVVCIRWDCDLVGSDIDMYNSEEGENSNFYINRHNKKVYDLLIQRPLIIKDALEKYSTTVVYVDSDSIATPYVDRIFDFYDSNLDYPYFAEGIYDYLFMGARGGAWTKDDLTMTLEYPSSELFGVDQYIRERYRQTGYFVAGPNCLGFLDEWYQMCVHPVVLSDIALYAPYNEETILNVLLWKKGKIDGLPLIYVNGSSSAIDRIYNDIGFTGSQQYIESWLRVPSNKEDLFFFHGEKRIDIMQEMLDKIKGHNQVKSEVKLKIVFYSDLNYEYQAKSLVESILITKQNVEMVYYTIGFESSLSYPGLIKRPFPVDIRKPRFEYYKPTILLDALEFFGGKFLFLDTDIIVGHRFTVDKVNHDHDFPLFSCGNWNYPFMAVYKDGETINVGDESNLMKYLGVEKRSMNYVYTCVIAFNDKCRDVILEWKSICDNEYLLEKREFYFIFHDETPLNVILWRRGLTENFGKRIYLNTLELDPLVYIEENEGIFGDDINLNYGILGNNLLRCDNSSDVMFYHGIKDNIILNDVIEYLKKDEIIDMATSEETRQKYNDVINTTKISIKSPPLNIKFNSHYVGNPFFEILGNVEGEFNVKFYDGDEMIHSSNLRCNMWTKLNRTYFTDWEIKVSNKDGLIHSEKINLKGRRVYLALDSKSLGDTLAWMPYLEEFRKKHECRVIASTFWNKFFKNVYKDIEFVNPGDVVNNLYAMYTVGWFYNPNSEPVLPSTVPLQKTATNILGLDYTEIRPLMDFTPGERPYPGKYVTIAPNSTAGLKFWNNETGWREVIDFLKNQGYEVVGVSKEGCDLPGVTQISDLSIENTMNVIHHSEFFIGLSSGLSWLSWAIGKHVVMISNFTDPDHEFTQNCTRITDVSVCHGCWNNPNFKFDKGDWNWCPVHKGTNRQFECHKKITGDMVINKIKPLIGMSPDIVKSVEVQEPTRDFDWGHQSEWYVKTIKSEIFEKNMYEAFFEVEEGDIVVDIGASIGPFAYSVLGKKPKHIFCVEPCEDEFPMLIKNTIGGNVTHILRGISDTNSLVKLDESVYESCRFGTNAMFTLGKIQEYMEGITFKTLCELYNIKRIDFLKTDCEGGEYDIFNVENFNFIKNNVKKIAGEWHMNNRFNPGGKEKFRIFRDTYLKNMPNHQVFSQDGVDIKWDLWNDHFIDYYEEIMIYIDNR